MSEEVKSDDGGGASGGSGGRDYMRSVEEALQKATGRAMLAHEKRVLCLGWSCDGSSLASGSADATVRIWAVDSSGSSKEQCCLRGHTGSVAACHWHPTLPSILATVSLDKTLRLWDAHARHCLATHTTQKPNLSVAWSGDGGTLLVADRDDVMMTLDTRAFTERPGKDTAKAAQWRKKTRFDIEVNAVTWSPNAPLVYLGAGHKSGGVDTGVLELAKLLPDGQLDPIVSMNVHTGILWSVDMERSGKYFATGADDGLVSIFDATELTCIRTYDRLDKSVRSVSFSHDGAYIATGGEDQFIDIFRVEDGARVRAIPLSGEGSISSVVAWHPSAHVLAFAVESKLHPGGIVAIGAGDI